MQAIIKDRDGFYRLATRRITNQDQLSHFYIINLITGEKIGVRRLPIDWWTARVFKGEKVREVITPWNEEAIPVNSNMNKKGRLKLFSTETDQYFLTKNK